jgi:hypothetical protein
MISLNSVGLLAPARTAKEIVDRIDRAIRYAIPTRNGSGN